MSQNRPGRNRIEEGGAGAGVVGAALRRGGG